MIYDKITIRPMVDSDLNFILHTWLRSFKESDFCWRIKNEQYYSTYEPMMKQIIRQSTSHIACLKDDQDVILGYLITQQNIIHYAFTKDNWRKLGVFNILLKHSNVGPDAIFTHWTRPAQFLVNRHTGFTYNPFIFWRDHAGKETNIQEC